MNWPIRNGSAGESLGQFHSNMREVCDALQDEPENTIAELADTLSMSEDTVARAVNQLLNERRILATFGRHRVQTFRVNYGWRQPEPAEVVAGTLTLFSATLRRQD